MTKWLQYMSEKTGKSIEELREEMRARGAKADKTKTGFGSMTLERRKEISQKALEKRWHGKSQEQ